MTDGLDAPGIILLIVFVPMLFTISAVRPGLLPAATVRGHRAAVYYPPLPARRGARRRRCRRRRRPSTMRQSRPTGRPIPINLARAVQTF